MKIILLLIAVLSFGLILHAQNTYKVNPKFKAKSMEYTTQYIIDAVGKKSNSIIRTQKEPSSFKVVSGDRLLSFIPIGQSGNAYGFFGNPRTYIWADDNINSVVFTHRMILEPNTYGTGRIAYDVSTERGLDGTWTNNIQVYDPLGTDVANARYPEGGIYNPLGNTDPSNAYYSYYIPTLDGSNGSWGGFAHGVNNLTAIDPPEPTQHNLTTGDDFYRMVPNAYTITQDGISWMTDINNQDGVGFLGELIIAKGTFNAGTGDYEYEEWLMEILDPSDGINDEKIAFSPDGQTGYICIISNTETEPLPYTHSHPVLYKTTDGGEVWDDEPIQVQLGGEDGLETVKNFIADETLDEYFPGGWNRDELYYTLANHCDMAIDADGNPHITGYIALAAEEGGWYPYYEVSSTFHIFSLDGGETWDATHLYFNKTWDGDLGGISEYNRPQISTTMDGRYLFFSWIDSDIEGLEENTSPDIYCVSYDLYADIYSEVENITMFTQAMWVAFMGSQSHYVFTEINGNILTCTIPFVYQELDPGDPAAPVQFWYIDGFTYDFLLTDINEFENNILDVSQNYPNPFNGTSVVTVKLEKATDLSLEVLNLTGQKVYKINNGKVGAGSHTLTIDASKLSPGVYFYTVFAGEDAVTKKMIVN